jgi:glucose/arabinose dehydrogenase
MINRACLACLVSLAILLCVPSNAVAQLRAEVVASGFSQPLNVTVDPVVPGVFYVIEQAGSVRVVRNGQVLSTPFIDLSSVVSCCGERGLLGMAFPPNAGTTGRVFFNFTDVNGHTRVARFTRSASNPLVVDPATRFDLQWSTGERLIRQPFANHNGGHLQFGPDGYLYIGMGDGGSGNDPENNAQNPATLLGKMLRIDVNVPDGDPNGFRVPADNPFLDGQPIAALPEIWAFGLRNPWRYSFDDVGSGATGALLIGDVGQNAREEVNYEPFGAGGRNYGWRIREARIPTPGVPPTSPAYGPLTDPIYDYTHDDGMSVTGGFVYRGTQLPAAYRGRYFFADFVRSRVWSLGLSINPATGEALGTDIVEHTNELGGSSFLGGIASFGRDLQGELYLSTFVGRILRISASAGVAPNAPRAVRASVTGNTVVVRWEPPAEGPVPAQYRLEAGSVSGASNLGVVTTPGPAVSMTFTGIPAGRYFVRLRGLGAGGAGQASEEVIVDVSGGCAAAPPAPFGFAALVNGRNVTLVWDMSATSNGPDQFVIEAGSASGAANLAVLTMEGVLRTVVVAAPPGEYFVRMRARNACGTSGVSNEIVVRVF